MNDLTYEQIIAWDTRIGNAILAIGATLKEITAAHPATRGDLREDLRDTIEALSRSIDEASAASRALHQRAVRSIQTDDRTAA